MLAWAGSRQSHYTVGASEHLNQLGGGVHAHWAPLAAPWPLLHDHRPTWAAHTQVGGAAMHKGVGPGASHAHHAL